jgi:hypothetical protein
MSAKFATCQARQLCQSCQCTWKGNSAYLKVLLGLKDLCERLAGLNTKSVAQEPDFLDLVIGLQVLNVWLNVLGGGELEALALDGKDFGSRHCAQRLVQEDVKMVKNQS